MKRYVIGLTSAELLLLNGISLPFESFLRIKRTVKLKRNTGKVKQHIVTWPLLCPCSQTNLAL